MLFYHSPLQQNNTLVTSFCMQLYFRKGKYHCDESVLPVTKKRGVEKGRNQISPQMKTAFVFELKMRINMRVRFSSEG